MNKLLSSIIGGFLGATMITAVAVGVGVGNTAINPAKAETTTATLTFTGKCNGSGTDNKNNSWTITSDASESSFDSTKGIHYGTSSAAVSYLTISTTASFSSISKIVVNASGASGTSAKLNVTVGDSAFGTQKSLTSSAADYTLTASASGTVTVSITQSSAKKAIYCKSIAITYEAASGLTDVITPSNLGITSSSYTTFSGKKFSSDATYLGSAARNNSSGVYKVQLTSGNKNDVNVGIGTSISGGIIRKVSVEWGSTGQANTNGRYLTIRGSNTAYTATTLSTGTTLGTITYHTNDTSGSINEYTASDFSYVSIVASAAVYMSKITIEWDEGTAPTTYESSDTITRYTTGIANGSNTYAAWSGIKLTSGAVYAGKSAGSYNAVQINTNKSDSGIVTTASGGNVKSIVINFSTNTTDGRKVVVYGKSSAYESPADLFDSSTRGTSIGEATYAEGTTSYTITPSDSSAFIGIRSNGNALYIDSIVITWTSTTKPNTVSSLTVTSQPTNTFYGVGEKLDLTGLEVTASYEESGVSDEVTINYSTDPADGYTFVAGDVGSKTITISSRSKPSVTVTLTVTVVVAYPVSLTRTSPFVFSTTMTFAEGTGSVKATLTDGSEVTNIRIGDSGTELTIGGNTVSASATASDYANQNAVLSYTSNGKTVAFTFKVVIEDDLLIDHFDDVPNYILSGETATIEAHYTSFIGKPAVSVVVDESESDKISVSFNENNVTYDSTTKVGTIPFVVTAGNTAGQYSISVTISKDGEEASNSCPVIVRTAAPGHEGSGQYELVTSVNDVTTGKYVIAANVDGTYISMTDTFTSNKKFAVSEITVEDNIVTSSTSAYSIFDITRTGDNLTIQSGNNYVRYSGSSTDMAFASTTYNWTLSASSSGVGTFRLLASTTANETTKRALGYHAPWGTNANNVFGPYGITNYKTSSKSASYEYYEIELFKYNGSEQEDTGAAEFELVKNFVDSYMHMEDIPITNTNDTGACRGTNGYYLTAKAAWHTMVTGYSGSRNLEDIFRLQFPDAYQRYVRWAEKNGDTQPFVGNTIVPATKAIINYASSDSAAVVVVAMALLTTVSVSGYFVLKKKRLHK